MLPKANRLTKKNDFEKAFKEGKSSYDKFLGIKIVQNPYDFSRFGILVGSKVDKKAVIRNKIKRRVRSILINRMNDLKTGFDMVIITLPAIRDQKIGQIKLSLDSNLKRLKMQKK